LRFNRFLARQVAEHDGQDRDASRGTVDIPWQVRVVPGQDPSHTWQVRVLSGQHSLHTWQVGELPGPGWLVPGQDLVHPGHDRVLPRHAAGLPRGFQVLPGVFRGPAVDVRLVLVRFPTAPRRVRPLAPRGRTWAPCRSSSTRS